MMKTTVVIHGSALTDPATASTPREYTPEEVRERLLRHIHTMVAYWERESCTPDTRGKLEGLAFSICAALDGSSIELPAFEIRPCPHPTDKDYCRDQGQNWFPTGVDVGPLHEYFHQYAPKKE